MNDPDRPDVDEPTHSRLRQFAVEATIGVAIGLLLVYVAWASSGEVPFVYQGY